MNPYNRNVFDKINRLLNHFPVVAIIGARQTGKTTLAKQLRPNWRYVDLENTDQFIQISIQTRLFLENNPKNVIFDEAQLSADLFANLRGVIDEDREQKGRYIISASSSPELLKHVSETLAGRVAVVELGTLKANELAREPLSDFYKLFEQKLDRQYLPSGEAPIGRDVIQNAWFKGGYPEPQINHLNYFQWMQNYRDTYLSRDVAALFPNLNKIAYQRFLGLLGNLSGTIINRSDLARSIEVDQKTIRNYLDIATGTFLWRQLPSYERSASKSIVKMPKGHMRDTGLLHFLRKVGSLEDLYADPIVGHSFESFVIEEILKGLEATDVVNWDMHYFRTRNGLEVDCILEGYFGILPIEIKYGSSVQPKQLRPLTQFTEANGCAFGIVINQATYAEWIAPNIFQLPVGWL